MISRFTTRARLPDEASLERWLNTKWFTSHILHTFTLYHTPYSHGPFLSLPYHFNFTLTAHIHINANSSHHCHTEGWIHKGWSASIVHRTWNSFAFNPSIYCKIIFKFKNTDRVGDWQSHSHIELGKFATKQTIRTKHCLWCIYGVTWRWH